MGKLRHLSPELWPLNDVILCSYIEIIFLAGYHACLQRFLNKSLNENMEKARNITLVHQF